MWVWLSLSMERTSAHFQPTTPCRKLKRKLDQEGEELSDLIISSKKQHFSISPERTRRCDLAFFDCPCAELARKLLGCILVREEEGERCWGHVVETEAYLGGSDKAAHSYNGRRTERNEAMYMPPGTAYMYSIYGIHQCFNISSRGEGAAVLVRALEPLGGVESMTERRRNARKKDLCNGPAKLCQAMKIDKMLNKVDLVSSKQLWVELPEEGGAGVGDVHTSGRIGVNYAGQEWASKPLRFYINKT